MLIDRACFSQPRALGRLLVAFCLMTTTVAVMAAPLGAEPPGPEASLAVGDDHTCVLVEQGRISCVGDGDSGQLGDSANFEDRRKPHLVVDIEDAIGVSAGEDHTCAVLASGLVRCWGDNDRGQLGNGGGPDRSAPVTVSNLTDAVAVAAGDNHTCAVRENGTVVCWGANGNGQLGNGNTTDTNVPVFVTNIGRAQSVSAGQFHTCVVTSDDFVSCWGGNQWGQLGDGTTTDRSQAVRVARLDEVSSVAAGYAHTCATEKTGDLKCWGSNEFGQLGIGASTASLRPAVVPGISNARQVSVGYRTTCVVAGGAGYCFGNNDFGQLGDGTVVSSRTPVAIVGAFPISAVGVGDDHSCFIADSLAVSCWGINADGQLGSGNYVDQVTPLSLDASAYIAIEQLPPPTNLDELVNRPNFTFGHAQVLRLYQGFFAREPDLGGAIYWIDRYDNGDSLATIANFFADSPEFKSLYGNTGTDEFLQRIYRNILGRAPEPGGLAFWTAEINAGLPRGNMVAFTSTAAPEFVDANRYGGF